MMTTIFYYNHYKPYIVSENGQKKSKISSSTFNSDLKSEENLENSVYPSYQTASTESIVQTPSYYLNKALKDDIKSYMQNIVVNFNGIKGCTNYLALKLNNNFFIKENVENSADAISYFVNRYNKCLQFLQSNKNVDENLKKYVNSIQDIIKYNEDSFNSVGLTLNQDQNLIVDKDFNQKFSQSNYNILENLKNAYQKIYQKTCNTMSKPLSTYMNFKDFSCYFNYSIYENNQKTFILLQRGLVFDMGI